MFIDFYSPPHKIVITSFYKSNIYIFLFLAAATLNRLSYSRDHPERRQRQQTTFLYNNNFHNQSFTAIHGGPTHHNIMPNINLNLDTNHKSNNNGVMGNTFNGNGILMNRAISNGGAPSYCGQGLDSDLQQGKFQPNYLKWCSA